MNVSVNKGSKMLMVVVQIVTSAAKHAQEDRLLSVELVMITYTIKLVFNVNVMKDFRTLMEIVHLVIQLAKLALIVASIIA